eukprot:1186301-Pleurochrysis_carterae.AAC.3
MGNANVTAVVTPTEMPEISASMAPTFKTSCPTTAAPRVAVCLSGQLRTFPHRAVWQSIQNGLVTPLRADTFLRISHDPIDAGAAGRAHNKSLLTYFSALEFNLVAILSEMQPVSVRMAFPYTKSVRGDDNFGAQGRFGTRTKSVESREFESNETACPIRSPREPITRVQFLNLRDVYEQVVEHEKATGKRYDWLVRARFDAYIRYRLPCMLDIEHFVGRDAIILARQMADKAAANEVNPFQAELRDVFAMVPRHLGEAYFRFGESWLWCDRDRARKEAARYCGAARGKCNAPECWLAVHLSEALGPNATDHVASINLAAVAQLTYTRTPGYATSAATGIECQRYLDSLPDVLPHTDTYWWQKQWGT